MRFKEIVYTIMSIFLLFSCSTREKSKVGQKKDLVNILVEEGLNNRTDRFLLSEVVKDIEIIPLETSRESLVDYIWNIGIGENDLFISVLKTILRFDRSSGHFLNPVVHFGQGPEDVFYCSGIGVDDLHKWVYTLAGPMTTNEVKRFTYDGKWQNTVKVAKNAAWMESGSVYGLGTKATRTYCYLDGKHIFRRMLPIQDGSEELWQISYWNTKFPELTVPGFTNDLCGGLPFFPFDQNENCWIAKYEATDLLEQIDIDELRATDVLMPEKKEQLIRVLENLKEDDNPVIMIATLK